MYQAGGTVERLIETTFLETDNLVLNLHQGDFSVTNQVAEAINDIFGGGVAVPLDARLLGCVPLWTRARRFLL